MENIEIEKCGNKYWYSGMLHRVNGPAIEHNDGRKEWYYNGKFIGDSNHGFTQEEFEKCIFLLDIQNQSPKDCYFQQIGIFHITDNIKLEVTKTCKSWHDNTWSHHREDGPAIEWANGDKEWYINGYHHREDGPAVECYNGTKEWYINGNLHREDGPAREYIDGSKEWWYNDELIGDSEDGFTQKDFDKHIRSLKIKEYW